MRTDRGALRWMLVALCGVLGGATGMRALAERPDRGAAPPPAAPMPADRPLAVETSAAPQRNAALYRLALAQVAAGEYREAAERFEALAKGLTAAVGSMPGGTDGDGIDLPAVLQRAARLRRDLGDSDKYVEDVRLFIRLYGSRKELAETAAGLFFDVGQHYEDLGATAKLKPHYEEYLKVWGERGGLDRRLGAEVRLAELAWRSSCPVPGVYGVCADLQRQPPLLPLQRRLLVSYDPRNSPRCKGATREPCDPRHRTRYSPQPRTPALVREALGHLRTALRLRELLASPTRTPSPSVLPPDRAEQLDRHSARALLLQGDVLLDELMRRPMPAGLYFDPRRFKRGRAPDPADKRFAAWLADARGRISKAQALYEPVTRLQGGSAPVVAAARIGQLYLLLADTLHRTPLPPPTPAPAHFDGFLCWKTNWPAELATAYCDQVTDQTDVLEAWAEQQFQRCVGRATELGDASEWARLCELELYQLRPETYPLPAEIFAPAGRSDAVLDVAPLSH